MNEFPDNGRIELDAAFLEKLLADRAASLEPLANLLSGFYAKLVNRLQLPAEVAAALTIELERFTFSQSLQQSAIPAIDKKVDELKAATDMLNRKIQEYIDLVEEYEDDEEDEDDE